MGNFSFKHGLGINLTKVDFYDEHGTKAELPLHSVCIAGCNECFSQHKDTTGPTIGKIYSNIILLAFLPIHQGDSTQTYESGKINPQMFQASEALLWAVDYVNKKKLLKNQQLGILIFDSFSTWWKSSQDVVNFMTQKTTIALEDKVFSPNSVIGAIGGYRYEEVKEVLDALSTLQITTAVVGAPATNMNHTSHPSVLQGWYSNNDMVTAIVKVALSYEWQSINILHSNAADQTNAAKLLQTKINTHGICLGKVTKLSFMSYDNVINGFLKTGVRTVVLFLTENDALGLIRILYQMKQHEHLKKGQLFLIFAGIDINQITQSATQKEILAGSLAIAPKQTAIPGFLEHFESLTPLRHMHNPWLREYWEQKFECQMNSTNTLKRCGLNLKLKNIHQGYFIKPVVNSVLTFAHGLRKLMEKHCDVNETIICKKALEDRDLNTYILGYVKGTKIGTSGNPLGASDGPYVPTMKILNILKEGDHQEVS